MTVVKALLMAVKNTQKRPALHANQRFNLRQPAGTSGANTRLVNDTGGTVLIKCIVFRLTREYRIDGFSQIDLYGSASLFPIAAGSIGSGIGIEDRYESGRHKIAARYDA